MPEENNTNNPSPEKALIPSRSIILRSIAYFFSYLFHPVFIPLYVVVFLSYWHPLVFAGITERMKVLWLAAVFVNCTLFPVVTVFLSWRLKFVSSFHLYTRKDRIIPYALGMVFYFWCWYVFKNNPSAPELLKHFLLGSFIAVIFAWLANIYFKVSMHGIAIGSMTFFLSMIAFTESGSPGIYLTVAWLILGIVGTSRLIIGAHHPADVYAGIILGMTSQFLPIYL